jgi:hypothetical protein
MKQNTVIGKHIISCPACGCTVREDLLGDHTSRCARAAARQPKPTQNDAPPLQRKKKPQETGRVSCPVCKLPVPAPHYDEHVKHCQERNAGLRRLEASAASPDAPAAKQMMGT